MYHIIQSYPVGIIQTYIRFCYFSCKIKHVIDFSLYNTNVIIDFCDGILVRDTLKYFLIIFFQKMLGGKLFLGCILNIHLHLRQNRSIWKHIWGPKYPPHIFFHKSVFFPNWYDPKPTFRTLKYFSNTHIHREPVFMFEMGINHSIYSMYHDWHIDMLNFFY